MAAATAVRVDTSEFSAAMREYMRHSKRDFSEVLNQKGYSISMAAAKPCTKRASKAKIRSDLRKVNIYALTQLRQRQLGRAPFPREELRDAAKKYKQERIDAAGFLAAGWLSAVAVFARAIRKEPKEHAKKFLARFGYFRDGRPTGSGIACRPSWFPRAELSNMAFSRYTSTDRGKEFAASGLGMAISQEVKRMAEHLAKKLQTSANRYLARWRR